MANLVGHTCRCAHPQDLPPKFRDASLHPERSSLPQMGEMLRDQIQAFKGKAIEIETQAEMVQHHQQSL